MKCSIRLEFSVLFREETGKFVIIGKTEAVGFFSHYLVKFGIGRFDIGLNEELADAAAKHSDEHPADEGKAENEDLPFFAFGHLLRKFESALAGNLRIFRKDVGDHAVFIGFDDSGNYEKQAPEEDFKIHKEHYFNYIKIVSAFEDPENAFDFGTGNSVFHKEAVHSHKNGIAYKQVE